MKIERINDNKLKIVLTKQDLIEKDIDIHTLNPNSIESQDLFFDILQELEFYYGFDMGNSQILLEGISTSNGGMILTVTRNSPNAHSHEKKKPMPKIKATKKECIKDVKELIYKFDSFDSFLEFVYRLKRMNIKYENSLYEYNENYYLVLSCTADHQETYKKLLFILSDYATFTANMSIKNKLCEHGSLIISKTAIQTLRKTKTN